MEELLSFVFDYMLLPKEMENEFMASPIISSLLKTDDMTAAPTRGQKMLMDLRSIAFYGKPVDELLADKEAEKKAEKKAATKAATEEGRQNMVHVLLKVGTTPEKIAEVSGLKLSYVLKIAKKYAANEG